jgi:hypothetical protein
VDRQPPRLSCSWALCSRLDRVQAVDVRLASRSYNGHMVYDPYYSARRTPRHTGHSWLDALIHAQSGTDNSLTRLDDNEPEEIAEHRRAARREDVSGSTPNSTDYTLNDIDLGQLAERHNVNPEAVRELAKAMARGRGTRAP